MRNANTTDQLSSDQQHSREKYMQNIYANWILNDIKMKNAKLVLKFNSSTTQINFNDHNVIWEVNQIVYTTAIVTHSRHRKEK